MAAIVSNENSLVLNGRHSISRTGIGVKISGEFVYVSSSCGKVDWKVDYKKDTVDGASFANVEDLFDALRSFNKGGGDGDGVAWDNINDVPDSLTSAQAAGTPSIRAIGTGATQAAAGNHTHAAATTSANGFMSSADKTKLNGVATGATVNDTDANLLNRANHTGTQPFNTISGTATAAQIPTLAISKTSGLQSALDGKANIGDLPPASALLSKPEIAALTVASTLEDVIAALQA